MSFGAADIRVYGGMAVSGRALGLATETSANIGAFHVHRRMERVIRLLDSDVHIW